MVMGKSPIMPTTWTAHGQPPSDASEKVPMVTQLDEERRHLWEMAKANLEKGIQAVQGFCEQVLTRVEF
jgi:hypothetical protein